MRSVARLVGLGIVLTVGRSESDAQQPQIPTLQVCNQTRAKGAGTVKIDSRVDPQHTGTFAIRLELQCDVNGYPIGQILVRDSACRIPSCRGNGKAHRLSS
jgi:hypothetical protein